MKNLLTFIEYVVIYTIIALLFLWSVSWMTVFPTIGLLWVIGWI
jgi:hypothetical protein